NLTWAVEHMFTRSPRDTVRSLPSMGGGDTLGGSFAHGQYFDGRPFPGAGGYRTYLTGLYLCGSATHPGGNITGLPGYNAARVILNDLGLDLDCFPLPMDSQLEALAG